MRILVAALALGTVLMLAASQAAALEPPASDEQMTAAAQAIARVEVEQVVCLGPPKDEGDWEVTRYRATMRRIEAIKGEVPERFELLFAEIDADDGVSHSVTFEPGWRGRVFLSGKAPSFSLVEWNGAIGDPDAQPGELPSCGGGCGACALHPAGDEGLPLAVGALGVVLVAHVRRRRFRS